ncbi:MAG: T9SS type A sorting domain-containing protein, partial [Candidatus Eisenbacteria bacterium]|nr:T9SS type A sorting domain-containing protein [Candidatus Eisenbacteria bacterium]
TIGGSGDVAVLTFRALGGTYELAFEDAVLRGAENEDLAAELGDLESKPEIPRVFRLVQNSPNPFNPVTSIAYHVPQKSEVSIRVYDVTGRLVRTLVDGMEAPGVHEAVWDGRSDRGESVGSGVYFCVMEAAGFHDSRKMTLLK